MNKFDYSDLDGRLLQILVAVAESGSITAAAARLGVTQSAVSHQLDKLRAITHDPLFVKSGRGIVTTARAQTLAQRAREMLRDLEAFSRGGEFDPAHWQTLVTVAANDFQRDLLLPRLMAHLQTVAPGVQLRVIPSNIPSPEMLRQEHCQLAISPRPPDVSDVMQKRLFEDEHRVFYDASQRQAPTSLQDYLASEHITVVYEPKRSLDIDQWLLEQGVQRRFKVLVPGFAAVSAFLRGSCLLATAPSLLARQGLQGLAHAALPMACPRMPMYLLWHQRYHQDVAHQWLRALLVTVAASTVQRTSPSGG